MIDSLSDVPVARVKDQDARKVPKILRLFPSDEKTLITGETWVALCNLHKGEVPPADFDPIQALTLKYIERTEAGFALTRLGKEGVEARLAFEKDLAVRAKCFKDM